MGRAAFNSNPFASPTVFYGRNDDGTVDYSIIVSFAGVNVTETIVVPSTVEEIGAGAFSSPYVKYSISSIDLSQAIKLKKIGNSSFSSNDLTEIILPDSVETIGDSAFSSNELTNIIIPENVTKIGSYAFAWNDLTTVTIPKNVTEIGSYAFEKYVASGTENPSNPNLTNIINKTGKIFNWGAITGANTYYQEFVTGTITHEYGDITVTAE